MPETGLYTTDSRPWLISQNRSVYYYALWLLLLFPVFVDLINGFFIMQLNSDFSFGMLYRGAAVAICFWFVFFIRERLFQLYFFLLVALWLSFNIVWKAFGKEYLFLAEALAFSKTIFTPVMIGFLMFLTNRFKIDIRTLMEFVSRFGVVAALTLIFSFVFDIGSESYKAGFSYGSKSFFQAQNDIGLALAISFPITFYFFYRKLNLAGFLAAVTVMFGLISLSTRTGIMSAFGVFFLYLFVLMAFGRGQIKMKVSLRIGLIMTMLISAIVGGFFFVLFLFNYPFILTKFLNLFSESVRAAFIEAAIARISDRLIILDIFGEGMVSFFYSIRSFFSSSESMGGKSTENDIYDQIGGYGYILGSLFLILPLIGLLRAFYLFILRPNLLNITMLASMGLYIFHSYNAGHAISSPTLASVICVVYVYLFKTNYFLRIMKESDSLQPTIPAGKIFVWQPKFGRYIRPGSFSQKAS